MTHTKDIILERAYDKDGNLIGLKKVPTNRTFGEGSGNRNSDLNKIDPEGYISPLVIKAFSEYMLKHQFLADGTKRESDNWQKLFGDDHLKVCMKSATRHFLDWWLAHRGEDSREGIEDALGGIIFNAMGYWHKLLKDKTNK